jgi:two-component sensor histidine kinase
LFCTLSTAHAQENTQKQDSLKRALANHHTKDTQQVILYNKLATTYFQTDVDSLAYYARLALSLANHLSYPKGQADAEAYIATYSRIKGNYSAALTDLFHSNKTYESLHSIRPLAYNYLDIGQVYKDMSGATRTLEYINTGLGYCWHGYNLFISIHDTAGMIDALNMCGILYRDIAKKPGREHYFDSAFSVYTKAVALINQSGKGKSQIAKLYNNISQVYNEYWKDYAKALEYLFKAADLNKSNNSISGLSYNYANISQAYRKLNKPVEALVYARKMLETALLLNRPERIRNAYSQMYEVFQFTNRSDSALYYYKLSDQLDDSLNNVAKTNEVSDLQTKYESGKKELEIRRLNIESIAKNKQIIILVSALIIFALLTACMLWLYQRIKKQRQEITNQSKKLEIMMKELHHRVKNNLQIVSSLLSLQTYKVQDEEAVLVLKESQQRVQAMSFIHQRLYKTESLTAVNMKEYLTDLAESLVSSYGFNRDDFDLYIKVEKEMLDIDKALPIGLIINEIVTNALKYAYSNSNRPALHITLSEEDTKLVCTIKDNGIGIDEQQWKQKKNSFGKQLITALCKQLRAQQTLVVNEGTQFMITIPKQAA